MRYLIDTGLIVRLPHRTDPHHEAVRVALRDLARAGHTFVTTPQNIAEFWNVCTRPASARGGFGLSQIEVHGRLRLIERLIEVLPEPSAAYEGWKRIVQQYRVAGRQVHDAKIVASMVTHRIRRILTLNDSDFVRYVPEIEVFSPQFI